MGGWKPNKPNDSDDEGNNNNKRKASNRYSYRYLRELKEKGLNAVTYARTFLSLDYKGKIFTFTVHREDITRTRGIYDKELA